jgi:hypothetical protein
MPFGDWLAEQENRRGPAFFLLEWLIVFSGSLVFWVILLLEVQHSPWSLAAALAVSSVYASCAIYLRVSSFRACTRCHASLAVNRVEIGRRCVRERERCLEIERGGEEWYGHFIDLYTRTYRVEIVKYRCRRCNRVWEQTIEEPVCDYQLVRTIDVKD